MKTNGLYNNGNQVVSKVIQTTNAPSNLQQQKYENKVIEDKPRKITDLNIKRYPSSEQSDQKNSNIVVEENSSRENQPMRKQSANKDAKKDLRDINDFMNRKMDQKK